MMALPKKTDAILMLIDVIITGWLPLLRGSIPYV